MGFVVTGLPSTQVLATAVLTFGVVSLNETFALFPDNHVLPISTSSVSCQVSSPHGTVICIKYG